MFIDIFVSTNDVLLIHHYATDFSAGPEGDEKSFPKNVVGSVTELLESVKSGKKILNSLEFPMLDPPSSTLHIPLTWQHGVPPAAFTPVPPSQNTQKAACGGVWQDLQTHLPSCTLTVMGTIPS